MNSNWVTPREILEALGHFDMDPCATEAQAWCGRPWPTAKAMYSKKEDGLSRPWDGRVWLNPPYERPLTGQFVQRLAEHGDGVALVMARTDTAWFQEWVFGVGSAVLFLRRRPHFYTPEGVLMSDRAMSASALVAYGEKNVKVLKRCGIDGKLIRIRR